MQPTELEPIESMKLEELAEAVEAQQDDISSWEAISNQFRMLRHNGEVWCIIPTSKISTIELALFVNVRVSRYAICFRALEGNNLNMFMLAAMRAKEEHIKFIDR